ncbi:adipocyte enhancer-binding protein 1-like [Branchiostoma floridae x Branchiostoma belcheri]
MRSGAIHDQQISASSFYGPGWEARHARVDGRYAWRPAQRHRHEWLAVDLGRTVNITGVMTQGHLSYESPRRPYYLKRFELDFKTQYDEEWTSYKIDGKDVTFDGNNDTGTVVTNILPEPVLATAIRFHPAGWHSNGFALRVEILGCSLSEVPSTQPPGPIATTTVPPFPAKTTHAAGREEGTTVHDSSAWTMGFQGTTEEDDTITIVAGAILGCVALLVAILVCVLLYKRRKMIGSPETEADPRYDNVISYSRVLEESTLDQPEQEHLVWNDFYESADQRGGGAEYACVDVQNITEDNEKTEVENDLYQSPGI